MQTIKMWVQGTSVLGNNDVNAHACKRRHCKARAVCARSITVREKAIKITPNQAVAVTAIKTAARAQIAAPGTPQTREIRLCKQTRGVKRMGSLNLHTCPRTQRTKQHTHAMRTIILGTARATRPRAAPRKRAKPSATAQA